MFTLPNLLSPRRYSWWCFVAWECQAVGFRSENLSFSFSHARRGQGLSKKITMSALLPSMVVLLPSSYLSRLRAAERLEIKVRDMRI